MGILIQAVATAMSPMATVSARTTPRVFIANDAHMASLVTPGMVIYLLVRLSEIRYHEDFRLEAPYHILCCVFRDWLSGLHRLTSALTRHLPTQIVISLQLFAISKTLNFEFIKFKVL